MGSAIFAGVGIGAFNDVESAVEQLVNKNLTYVPETSNYEELYKDYKKKEKALMQIF